MLLSDEHITLAHGSGGAAMAALIEQVFKPVFNNEWLNQGEDQARITLENVDPEERLAITTDSYVISPIVFPGGDIGKLAVCGTLNDLAVGGAVPKYLSVGFILEEGLPMATLRSVVASMQQVAQAAGVAIVTGDTKVVPKGAADQIYINTTGFGFIPKHRKLGIERIQEGDLLLVNRPMGNHGAAIADVRESLGFVSDLKSDCASLVDLIDNVLTAVPDVRCIRDATRGGVATVANEFAMGSGCSLTLYEADLPVDEGVKAICELLGYDPLYLANEGNALWVVPADKRQQVLSVMHAHADGQQATVIGEVGARSTQPSVSAINSLGASHRLDLPAGELLPRIC